MNILALILLLTTVCLETSNSRSLRSKRYADFSIRCRQNNDFTWDCICPQRNVIMTMSDSSDEFLVCGMDFKLSLLSKAPRFGPQQQQRASYFDRQVEHETPNKLFRGRDDFYPFPSYNSRGRGDFRNAEGQNYGRERYKDERYMKDSFRVNGNGQHLQIAGDYGKIQNAQEQNFRNNYRHGYDQYPSRSPFNPPNGYHTTRPNEIISEEKLDQNLKQVLSRNKFNGVDKIDPSNDNQDINHQDNSNLETSDTITNYNKNENIRHSISSTVRYRSTKGTNAPIVTDAEEEINKIPVADLTGQDTSTGEENGLNRKGLHGSSTGDVMHSNIENQMDSQASENVRPTSRSALDNVNHDEKHTLTSEVNADDSLTGVDEDNLPDITTRSTLVTAKSTHIFDLFNTPNDSTSKTSLSTDKNYPQSTTITESTPTSTKKSNSPTARCYFAGHVLAFGESVSIGSNCKLVCVHQNSMERNCTENRTNGNVPNNTNSHVKLADDHLSSTNNTTNIAIKSSNVSDLANGENNLTSVNSTTHDSDPAINSTLNDKKPEMGCYYYGKTIPVGESISISYSCKLVCVHQNSMKRDCSGTKTLESKQDPKFSLDDWTP